MDTNKVHVRRWRSRAHRVEVSRKYSTIELDRVSWLIVIDQVRAHTKSGEPIYERLDWWESEDPISKGALRMFCVLNRAVYLYTPVRKAILDLERAARRRAANQQPPTAAQ